MIWRTLGTCFFFGAFCTLFFFLFGNRLGIFLFHSETAGVYIKNAGVYLPVSLYQHHPGKHYERAWQTRCLSFPQCCGSVHPHWLCDPFRSSMGIRGYFYGMLISQLILTLLHFIYLNRIEDYRTDFHEICLSTFFRFNSL